MFDRAKARLAKLEEDHEKIRKAHQHFVNHKTTYLVGAGCLATGFVIRGNSAGMKQMLETNPRISGLAYKSAQTINNTVVQEMVRQGDPGRKTYWVEKQLWFPSRALAGKAADVSTSGVSKCCNGIIDSVKGQHFIDGGPMI